MPSAVSLLLLTVGLAPLQAGAQPVSTPAPAVAPQPAGRAFRLAQPVTLHFSADTNIGPVEGSIAVRDVVGRGLEGWGRFELVIRLDPSSVRTGDPLRDRVIRDRVLQASKGALVFTAYSRLAPSRADAAEDTHTASALPAAVGALDERRRRKPVELRYGWSGDPTGGTLLVEHTATLDALGLALAPHPFVQLTGPVRLRLEAPLVRER